jgi:hypothetical protein
MGNAMRRHAAGGRVRRRAAALTLLLAPLTVPVRAQQSPDLQSFQTGRFTVLAAPHDATLARSLLTDAAANDTFPWLPRPTDRVLIQIASNRRAFEELIGPHAPEYGSAIAFPAEGRIVMQGSRAGSDAGNPRVVLRHELAHLALHEELGHLPPRWFDEGYASFAAGEWGREEVLATNVSLIWRRVPSFDQLEESFGGGAGQASAAYALAHRAVAELASLDPERGLTLYFKYWKETGSFEAALRQAFSTTVGGFEELWQQRTRRRYGALALFADFTVALSVLMILLLPLYVSRRRRNRERLAAMARSEAAVEQRERESALEALLASVTSTSGPSEGTDRGSSS